MVMVMIKKCFLLMYTIMIGYKWYNTWNREHISSCDICGKLVPYNMLLIKHKRVISIIICHGCIKDYKGSIYVFYSSTFPYILFDMDFCTGESDIIRIYYRSTHTYEHSKIGNVISPGNDYDCNDGEQLECYTKLKIINRDFLVPKPLISPKKCDIEFIFDW